MGYKEKNGVKFYNSIRMNVIMLTVCAVLMTFICIEAMFIGSMKKRFTSTNQSYLLDMAIQTGNRLDLCISQNGFAKSTEYSELKKIFDGTGINGMETSYVYVVAADTTMLYHPTESKVGSPVTNEVVKGVANGLNRGEKYQPTFVQYVFNGAAKYAAYYVTYDGNAIVVATVDENEIMKPLNQLAQNGIITGIGIMLIVFAASLLDARRIVKPLTKLTENAKQISELDLRKDESTEALMKRKDEIGVVANSFNTMNDSLYEVVEIIKGQSEQLKTSAEELNDSTERTSINLDQIEKAIMEVADGATSQAEETQKATESVILMGNMVEETNAEVDKLSKEAIIMKNSSEVATNTLSELESINEEAKQAIEIISAQTETTNISAGKIREAAEFIKSIAEETNLLSLNASIEAARAGEHGRGFAVVASSIQKLAEQSNESARLIDKIIGSLIEDSGKTVQTMQDVRKIMDDQSEKVSKTVAVFSEVSSGIASSIEGINIIAEKTSKLDTARIEVVDVVQNLTAIAEENAASTQETSASATEVSSIVATIAENSKTLDGIADRLKENVLRFTL